MQSEINKHTALVLNFKCYKDNKYKAQASTHAYTQAHTHPPKMG